MRKSQKRLQLHMRKKWKNYLQIWDQKPQKKEVEIGRVPVDIDGDPFDNCADFIFNFLKRFPTFFL